MNQIKSWHIVKYQILYDENPVAYQVLVDKKLMWLPKSQVVLYKVRKKVEIPDWLYFKKFNPGT